MALRYVPTYDENGNVIAPGAFLEGASTFAGELNSGIDRDNLPPNTIVAADAAGGRQFTVVTDLAAASTSNYALDKSSTTWQGPAGNNADGIGYKAFTLTYAAHIQVFWSGSWSWDGSWSMVNDGVRPDRTDTVDTLRIRATIDGVEVFVLGPFEDGMLYGSAFGTGSIVLLPGAHTLLIQAESVRRIVQTGLTDGPCTNTATFRERVVSGLGRYR